MNQSEFDNLLQKARERDLTDGELAKLERWLAANPAEQAEWEALDRLLAALPDEPVTTNFTARVLDEIRRAETAQPALGQAWWQRLLAPQFRPIQIAAAATLAMVIGGVGYQSYLNQSRAEMAAAVASIAEFTPVFLADFEAIEAIAQADPIDEELWAALK
jgi:anti-sigma factor RsiW